MKKLLLATTALAAVAGISAASAQESQMMSAGGNTLNIGGYYEFGWASHSDDFNGEENGADSKTYGDSELYIDFETTSDMGLTYGVQIDLEIVNGSRYPESGPAKNAEESSLYVKGDFGTLHFGHDDNAYGRFITWAPTHEGATSQDDNIIGGSGRFVRPATAGAADTSTEDAAVTAAEAAVTAAQTAYDGTRSAANLAALNEAEAFLADEQAARDALDPTPESTYGHSLAYSGVGNYFEDNAKIAYVSPNFSGFQFGASVGDSDSSKDNPTALGASYSMDLGDMASGVSLTLTAANYTNGADGDDKVEDTQYGITVGAGDLTLTATQYSGDVGDEEKETTEFGIGFSVNDRLSVGASTANAENDVAQQEGSFQSISASYSLAPGLKTTIAVNQYDVEDNAELTSNDGSEFVWQLEFGF